MPSKEFVPIYTFSLPIVYESVLALMLYWIRKHSLFIWEIIVVRMLPQYKE